MKRVVEILVGTLFSIGLTIVSSVPAPAQTTDAEFQQAVTAYQQSPSDATVEKVIKMAAAMDQLPPIPEEARRHFVRGAALFKEAKSPEDFQQVIDEFKQATRLAPWWPEARYNWALAFEAAGDYAAAIDNLKHYRMFKLSEAEARTAQDKIYALEAKQEKAAKDAESANTERQRREQEQARQRQEEEAKKAKAQDFSGKWRCGTTYNGWTTIVITKAGGGYAGSIPNNGEWVKIPGSYMGRSIMQPVRNTLKDFWTSGTTVHFTHVAEMQHPEGPVIPFTPAEVNLSLSEDGNALVGKYGEQPITFYRRD
jgi:hypothetical protein